MTAPRSNTSSAAAFEKLRARGVRMGRPVSLPQAVRERVVRMSEDDGLTYSEIARLLTEEGVPTATGRDRWFPATVSRVFHSAELDRQAAIRAEEWKQRRAAR